MYEEKLIDNVLHCRAKSTDGWNKVELPELTIKYCHLRQEFDKLQEKNRANAYKPLNTCL